MIHNFTFIRTFVAWITQSTKLDFGFGNHPSEMWEFLILESCDHCTYAYDLWKNRTFIQKSKKQTSFNLSENDVKVAGSKNGRSSRPRLATGLVPKIVRSFHLSKDPSSLQVSLCNWSTILHSYFTATMLMTLVLAPLQRFQYLRRKTKVVHWTKKKCIILSTLPHICAGISLIKFKSSFQLRVRSYIFKSSVSKTALLDDYGSNQNWLITWLVFIRGPDFKYGAPAWKWLGAPTPTPRYCTWRTLHLTPLPILITYSHACI